MCLFSISTQHHAFEMVGEIYEKCWVCEIYYFLLFVTKSWGSKYFTFLCSFGYCSFIQDTPSGMQNLGDSLLYSKMWLACRFGAWFGHLAALEQNLDSSLPWHESHRPTALGSSMISWCLSQGISSILQWALAQLAAERMLINPLVETRLKS